MTWDKITDQRILTLDKSIQSDTVTFINEVFAMGIKLRVTQALRTIAEQDELYAQGRTKPGKIVTNAKGGESIHNIGFAVDICEIKDGKAFWNIDYDKIVPVAESLGFEWGGYFKSFTDKPHFQKKGVKICKDL